MKWNDFVFLPGMLLTLVGVLVIIAGSIIPEPALPVIGITLIGISLVVHIVLLRNRFRESAQESYQGAAIPPHIVHKLRAGVPVTYEDRLVRITNDSITFFHYSFPFFTSEREVMFRDIDHIDVMRATIMTGKWRIGGTGGFRTWYPLDWNRPSRDRIFHAVLKTGGMDIGFTVENPDQVIPVLRKKGMIAAEEVNR